jgi:hypothetical protein
MSFIGGLHCIILVFGYRVLGWHGRDHSQPKELAIMMVE